MIDPLDKLYEVAVASLLTIISIVSSIYVLIYGMIKEEDNGPKRLSFKWFFLAVGIALIFLSILALLSWWSLKECVWCRVAVDIGMTLSLAALPLLVFITLLQRPWKK